MHSIGSRTVFQWQSGMDFHPWGFLTSSLPQQPEIIWKPVPRGPPVPQERNLEHVSDCQGKEKEERWLSAGKHAAVDSYHRERTPVNHSPLQSTLQYLSDTFPHILMPLLHILQCLPGHVSADRSAKQNGSQPSILSNNSIQTGLNQPHNKCGAYLGKFLANE